MPDPNPRTQPASADRWPRLAVIAVFFVHGFLFASWTAHIPELKQHLSLSDGRLGLALLGAPIGSVLAIVVAARILPRVGSRPDGAPGPARLLRLGTVHRAHRFVRDVLRRLPRLGFLPGDARRVDEHPSDHGRAVLRSSTDAGLSRVVELRRPGRCGHGSICGGAGSLSEWAAARPGDAVPAGRRLALDPDDPRPSGGRRPRIFERQAASGATACSKASSLSSGASPSPTCCARVPLPIGPPSISATRCTPCPWSPEWVLRSMPSPCWSFGSPAIGSSPGFRPTAYFRCSPSLAALGFAGGLVIARPVSVLVGFALLGAGLGSVVPMTLRAAGAVANVEHRKGSRLGGRVRLGRLRRGTGRHRRDRVVDDTAHGPVPDSRAHRHRGRGNVEGERGPAIRATSLLISTWSILRPRHCESRRSATFESRRRRFTSGYLASRGEVFTEESEGRRLLADEERAGMASTRYFDNRISAQRHREGFNARVKRIIDPRRDSNWRVGKRRRVRDRIASREVRSRGVCSNIAARAWS